MNRTARRIAACLVLLLALLILSCRTTGPDGEPTGGQLAVADVVALFAGLTTVAIELEGTAAVMEHAPHLMPLIDADRDGILELSDFEAIDPRDPASLLRVYLAAKEVVDLIRKSRKR